MKFLVRSKLTAMTGICFLATTLPSVAVASSGTDVVASEGQPAHVNPAWAKGVGQIINDAARTSGWNSWFSEWPNDVNQYAFDVNSTKDLNRLINKLASVKGELRQIRLSYLKEPNSLGWTHNAPAGNGIAVIFSIGDQNQVDQWFGSVRKPFGRIHFVKTPVAVPPTLTLFVQNKLVDLESLEIPDGIEVVEGYVPTIFHQWNTTDEEQRKKQAASDDGKRKAELEKQKLDKATRATMNQIQDFLKVRDNKAEKS